ncbi:LOW QUALITY PROTEIN: ciliary microtubule inner protein 6 [Theristicus caerulescens]
MTGVLLAREIDHSEDEVAFDSEALSEAQLNILRQETGLLVCEVDFLSVTSSPNTYGIFNIDVPELCTRIVNRDFISLPSKRCSYSPWRNNPQPHYARLISSNVRLLNEPIYYKGAKDTKTKQEARVSHVSLYSTELQSTQRTGLQKPVYELVLPAEFSQQQPPSGIVPLATPRALKGLAEILQEQTSFSHRYNARDSANEPIRGTRHGAFVCAEIKPASAIVPRGTEIFLSARGSCSLERPKPEKGNSVKGMTSPSLFLQNSETVGSENHLSKPDVRKIAKAYPRIPVRGHKSSGISQTTEVDVGCPAGEEPFISYNEMAFDRWGGCYLLPVGSSPILSFRNTNAKLAEIHDIVAYDRTLWPVRVTQKNMQFTEAKKQLRSCLALKEDCLETALDSEVPLKVVCTT